MELLDYGYLKITIITPKSFSTKKYLIATYHISLVPQLKLPINFIFHLLPIYEILSEFLENWTHLNMFFTQSKMLYHV